MIVLKPRDKVVETLAPGIAVIKGMRLNMVDNYEEEFIYTLADLSEFPGETLVLADYESRKKGGFEIVGEGPSGKSAKVDGTGLTCRMYVDLHDFKGSLDFTGSAPVSLYTDKNTVIESLIMRDMQNADPKTQSLSVHLGNCRSIGHIDLTGSKIGTMDADARSCSKQQPPPLKIGRIIMPDSKAHHVSLGNSQIGELNMAGTRLRVFTIHNTSIANFDVRNAYANDIRWSNATFDKSEWGGFSYRPKCVFRQRDAIQIEHVKGLPDDFKKHLLDPLQIYRSGFIEARKPLEKAVKDIRKRRGELKEEFERKLESLEQQAEAAQKTLDKAYAKTHPAFTIPRSTDRERGNS